MISCLKVKRHEGNIQKFFIENGGLLLEEQVAFCNGRSNPLRHFSEKELLIATNYYDRQQMFLDFDGYGLYKGSLKDRPIIVKKYESGYDYYNPGFSPYKDIAIGSQMSVHKNVLKVLGCCLETKSPSVIYESAGTEILSKCISAKNVQPLPWKSRLKIAVDLANAIAYLHTAFSRPVVHGDINCSNILLDENNFPKLTHFGGCISIPEGRSHVEVDLSSPLCSGRLDLSAPEFYIRGYLTEKTDVYHFGMLLLRLLNGEDPYYTIGKHNLWDPNTELCFINPMDIVDHRITREGIEAQQLLDFTTLLLRCISFDEEERPTMMEVAKELKRINQSFPSPY